MRRTLVRVGTEYPMVGTLAFGVVDRGTNVVEVRPTSICALSCIFCSVNAGPKSRARAAEYIVDPDALVNAVEEVASYKGTRVEAHIDGMGDPGNYPYLVDLVQEIREVVDVISMQTRLYMLSESKIKELEEAGLTRINLSMDALLPPLARKLSGTNFYDVNSVLRKLGFILNNTKLQVIISPVLLPGLNEGEMEKMGRLVMALKMGDRIKYPLLIQKYLRHKRGRNPIDEEDWDSFWNHLRKLSLEVGLDLIPTGESMSIAPAKELPKPYDVGDVVEVRMLSPGIFNGECLAVPLRRTGSNIYDRVITIVGRPCIPNKRTRTRIIRNKDNIFIGV
ncbi:radical SAM protein [Thermocladium modestius]|uniref:radical SAM protein n=1 Tax=Thermocladium modestius TaxID=62609 RepID=UPI001E3B5C33|nr:radical SAM protein [Thermocladium modestius]